MKCEAMRDTLKSKNIVCKQRVINLIRVVSCGVWKNSVIVRESVVLIFFNNFLTFKLSSKM